MHVAGALPRAMAFAYDLLIRLGLYIGLLLIGSILSIAIDARLMQGFFFIAFFLIEWFFPVVFEVWRHGQTPGKKSIGLRVVCLSGQPVNLQESLIRNFLRTVDFMPFLWGFGLASTLITRHAQRLGDLAAGTVVVYAEPEVSHRRVKAKDEVDAALPPRAPLTRDEQYAVVSFADRLNTWTPQRQTELSNHASALTGAEGAEGRRRLLSTARWLQEGAQ